MEYICSDTNFWLDFSAVGRTHLPFRLAYTFIMNRDAVEDEILSPEGLGRELLALGLQPVDMTIEEFRYAEFMLPELDDHVNRKQLENAV